MMPDTKNTTGSSKPGSGSSDSEQRREAGRSAGGQNSPGNFKNDPRRAAAAGHKGGQVSGGNFKNDPQRAAEAGQKGGQASHGGRGGGSS